MEKIEFQYDKYESEISNLTSNILLIQDKLNEIMEFLNNFTHFKS